MYEEIRICHLAGENERYRTRHEPGEHEPAAECLEDSRGAPERGQIERWRWLVERKAEQLLCPMSHEQKGGHDSQHAEKVRRPRGWYG
jgi:hypothetical protein